MFDVLDRRPRVYAFCARVRQWGHCVWVLSGHADVSSVLTDPRLGRDFAGKLSHSRQRLPLTRINDAGTRSAGPHKTRGEQWTLLVRRPALAAQAVEDVLRFGSSVSLTRRKTFAAVARRQGSVVARGKTVLLTLRDRAHPPGLPQMTERDLARLQARWSSSAPSCDCHGSRGIDAPAALSHRNQARWPLSAAPTAFRVRSGAPINARSPRGTA